MKIIYIAGPYSGDGKQETIERNIREAEKYALALSNRHIAFFCSHLHTAHFTSGKGSAATEQFYYDMGMEFLKRCNAVLAMPGWETSTGARMEVEWAKKNHAKIFYPSSPQDLSEIEEWNKKWLLESVATFLSK